MKIPILAAAAALAVLSAALADGVPDPADVEASFDGARMRDELSGVLGEPAKQTRVRLYASASSKLSVKLSSVPADGTPITDMTLALCDDAGVDQGVGGSVYDRSVPGSGVISWKNVPLQGTGGYSFVLRGTGAGVWHMTLGGTMAKVKETFTSSAGLGVNAEAEVLFHGLRGGSLSFQLSPGKSSKFRGELVRIERPDGSTLDGIPLGSKGKLVLDADGEHRLVFRNVGSGLGSWAVKTGVKPAKLLKRRGYVRPEGTALVPKVKSVTPSSDFNKDDAAIVTITGLDFQPGADVRLVRDGRPDIVAGVVSVDSETQIRCTLNLDTAPSTGQTSVGTWNVGVWNAPVYGDAADPATLVKDSPTKDTKKTFNCLNSGSITLPQGVTKNTEVWQLDFNDEFQGDLNRMGLGSADSAVSRLSREAVEAYVVCFLRELMLQNETNGKLPKTAAPAVSFVLGTVPRPAGRAGEDYNRIEIGGDYAAGDDRDVTEPLLWGFAPLDPGNTHRDDLSIDRTDELGAATRVGHGARTRVLDPGSSAASPLWIAATAPLRQAPLTAADKKYFLRSFLPSTVGEANRYRDIVTQLTRASREVAAIVAHHVGRAMGLDANGSGPMANPDAAGNAWPVNGSLGFSSSDLATLTSNAVPATLPGSSKALTIGYFPLLSTQPAFLPNLTTMVAYSVDWGYVGGRANAVPSDYTVKYTAGNPPVDLALSYQGLSGTVRLYTDASQGLFVCDISYFRVTITDDVRGGAASFVYRLNVLPNIPLLRPGQEQNNATICRNTILATP